MHIEIPKDAELLLRSQAKSAGFASIDEYVANLIRRREPTPKLTRAQSLEKLRRLRAETPKMTRQEVVNMVAEARSVGTLAIKT